MRAVITSGPAKACLAVVVAAAVLLLAPLTARAQVLQPLPSAALFVFKINKLKPVSDKIAAYSTKLQLNQLQPGFADPLEHTQKQLGMTQGVDPQGEAAIVVVNGPMNEKQPPVLLLVPVTDYQAFLKNFQNPRQEDQLSIVKLKGDNDDSFVMKRGNYAVITPKREYALAKADGLKPTGLAG